VSTKFDVAGTYNYYCEARGRSSSVPPSLTRLVAPQPHQGAGMAGKVIVN
jgi:plastocyanin